MSLGVYVYVYVGTYVCTRYVSECVGDFIQCVHMYYMYYLYSMYVCIIFTIYTVCTLHCVTVC